jgi:histidyl-tRNA synthetase
MDIWGIKGIEAEAELLSSIVMFFKNIGLTSLDVKIKVNYYNYFNYSDIYLVLYI